MCNKHGWWAWVLQLTWLKGIILHHNWNLEPDFFPCQFMGASIGSCDTHCWVEPCMVQHTFCLMVGGWVCSSCLYKSIIVTSRKGYQRTHTGQPRPWHKGTLAGFRVYSISFSSWFPVILSNLPYRESNIVLEMRLHKTSHDELSMIQAVQNVTTTSIT